MAASCSILRWVSPNAAVPTKLRDGAAAPPRSMMSVVVSVKATNFKSSRISIKCTNFKPSMISTPTPSTSRISIKGTNFKSSRISSPTPWLMLPPAFEDENNNSNDNMVYKFYNLAENKVINLPAGSKTVGGILPFDDIIEFVSSSHGWLALFNPRNCDLFLCNPVSGRHIKLPPIHTLPIPKFNLRGGCGCVHKVITSCSPEEQDCRVMMSYGPERRLAFCSPTTSTEWTPIGALNHMDEDNSHIARSYEHFVYSSRQKLFYCITKCEDFEAWDLQDTRSPKVIPMDFTVDEDNYHWVPYESLEQARKSRPCAVDDVEEEDNYKYTVCLPLKFLVVAEEEESGGGGDLFLVIRHVMHHTATKLPYKTIDFDVHKYDSEKRAFTYMDDGSLDGLTLFIGNNHSFAIKTDDDFNYSKLKPNSIYFTDVNDLIPPEWYRFCVPYGGHDLVETTICTDQIASNTTTDQNALISFKTDIISDPYEILAKNWSYGTFVCNWIGGSCRNQRVTALNLSDFTFQGTISPNLGTLTFLTSLDLTSNNFTGIIPEELSNLRHLKYMYLGFNILTGTIPSWLGNLPELEVIVLNKNSFSGEIPFSLGNSSKIRILDAGYNLLDGIIPQEIGNLSTVEKLDLKYNKITGSIPYGVFNLPAIERIDLTGNSLSGALPENICNHISRISGLFLSQNLLEGQIPFDIYKCKELEQLSLSYNHFNGSIPKSIGWLAKLQTLYLGLNSFQG
ncbi:hypothetical protein BUALT_Bualt01G0009800 [Buddleja alternifolia]|uniref:KIB1-4 beta-propeller domain-containing protein n=1 Tax=Buddleja alternifolia TaxID=168488 RepID=A0AAV6YBF8_9LAMI|nr:hypothetical protein BUALT_Bualt01G0009800 [Buddleja alternifolia]